MDQRLHSAASGSIAASGAACGLVVTADDFGLALAVNEAVALAHASGILSAASLMVGAAAAADAVRRARALPGLRVGLHLVLVEGRATLPPRAIPDLVDGEGNLRTDLGRFAIEIAARPRVRQQVRAEIAAQFEAFRATGLALDHVNTHKHFHLHPLVAADILAIGRRYGLRALRVPSEPRRALPRATPGEKVSSAPILLAPWTALVRRMVRRHRVTAPDAVLGLTFSGAFTTERMVHILDNLPAGLVEIYLHPAVSDRFPGGAPGYRYTEELAALVDPATIAAWRRTGRPLGGYADALRSGFHDRPSRAEGLAGR